MKKALQDINESASLESSANPESIINLTKMLIERRKKIDTLEEKRQAELAINLNKEIDLTKNQFLNASNNPSKPKQINRDQVWEDYEDLIEELSESSDDEDGLDATNLDEEEIGDETETEVDPSLLKFCLQIIFAVCCP